MRLVTIVVLLLRVLPLQAAEPVLRLDFANDVGGWTAFGPGTSVQAEDGALTFAYTVGAGSLKAAFLPVGNLPFAGFHSLGFQVSTDVPTPVAVILSEKKPGGGNYSAIAWSTGREWQTVFFAASDFAVSDGVNDPVDPDHKLDPDQVESIAILDLGQMFSSQAAGGTAPFHVQAHGGPHSISIRAFEISRDPIPAAGGDVVDDFSRPMPGWFSPGGALLEQAGGKLTIHYRELPDVLRQLPARDYKGATHLAMDIASGRSAQLIISITERRVDGKPAARYNADFFVEGGGQPDHRELALEAFTLDENGPPDPAGKLDPNNIQSIVILDVSGESAENTLTMHDLRLVRR